MYGEYFFAYTCEMGYGEYMRGLGRSLMHWLASVNDLHKHLKATMEHMVPPDLWCEFEGGRNDSFLLYYRSCRGSRLAPVIVGIVHEVAQQLFGLNVSMEYLAKQNEGGSLHTLWRVRNETQVETETASNVFASEGRLSVPFQLDCPISGGNLFSALTSRFLDSGEDDAVGMGPETAESSVYSENRLGPIGGDVVCCPGSGVGDRSGGKGVGISHDHLHRLFPFHVVLNEHGRILQLGLSLRRFLRVEGYGELRAEDVLDITSHACTWGDFMSLMTLIDTTQILEVKTKPISLPTPPEFSNGHQDTKLLEEVQMEYTPDRQIHQFSKPLCQRSSGEKFSSCGADGFASLTLTGYLTLLDDCSSILFLSSPTNLPYGWGDSNSLSCDSVVGQQSLGFRLEPL